MITASYLDDKIKKLEKSFIENDCFLFMEMGLDPGIDHMSAMKTKDEFDCLPPVIISFIIYFYYFYLI